MKLRRATRDLFDADAVDQAVDVGPLRLRNPVVAASGTFGYGSEFAAIAPPSQLGAITVKSLAHFAHDGNSPLRTTEAAGGGMLNSVGLAGPGVAAWIEHELAALEATGATIIVSIWGRSVEDYAIAAAQLHTLGSRIAAIEVNLSCPNLGGHGMFAHSPTLTAETVTACVGPQPIFAKLTAQVTDIVAIAGSALDAGATGITAINTLPGIAIDIESRRPKLGAGAGGLSGAPIHTVALRSVQLLSQSFPGTPIIGTGGIGTGEQAIAMLLVGASCVGVGTATFVNPKATLRIVDEIRRWCAERRIVNVRDIIGELKRPAS